MKCCVLLTGSNLLRMQHPGVNNKVHTLELCNKVMENTTKESCASSKVFSWATFIANPGCI